MHPLVGLLRRFALDWLGGADADVCARIMAPDYVIEIGGHTLSGRDEQYVPGTLAQLARFPGLLLTAHALVTDGTWAALRFTEHGPSEKDGMAPAAWTGIGLFTWDGERLTRNVTEEDYHSRRRQLATGEPDPVDHPAAAPWAATPRESDPDAEETVRTWLASGARAPGVHLDDGWCGHDTPPLLDEPVVTVRELFSAGRDVGFAVDCAGRYRGGLPDTDGAEGRTASYSAVGLVTVAQDGAIGGHVVRDRVGLRRAVRA